MFRCDITKCKKLKKQNKTEILYTINENMNYCNHFGEQFVKIK